MGKRSSPSFAGIAGIKSLFRSSDSAGDLAALLASIVSTSRGPAQEFPLHFFEVELLGVMRLRNDRLMNPRAIAEYLSQVGPIPFASGFAFGTGIATALREHVPLSEIEIRVSDIDEPLCRPHRDVVPGDVARENALGMSFLKDSRTGRRTRGSRLGAASRLRGCHSQ